MPILMRIAGIVRAQIARLDWGVLMLLFLAHLCAAWGMMVLAGEDKLVAPDIWPYFYLVTATTVGYGDFAPQTSAGRWIDVLFVMPGGIGLFAALIGKATSAFVDTWRKGMRGQRDYAGLTGHTIILGWRGAATERMVDLLLADSETGADRIVLCATGEMDNPLPEKALFVCGESLAQPAVLRRAGVHAADRILIYGGGDEQTLAAAFAVLAEKPLGHVVVHFDAQDAEDLLLRHYPCVECTRSLAVDMLVRAAQDPGISRLTTDLLSVAAGPAEYGLRLPAGLPPVAFGDLLLPFKRRHDATLLGLAKGADPSRVLLNPRVDETVAGGDILYYMAERRIDVATIEWPGPGRGAL